MSNGEKSLVFGMLHHMLTTYIPIEPCEVRVGLLIYISVYRLFSQTGLFPFVLCPTTL